MLSPSEAERETASLQSRPLSPLKLPLGRASCLWVPKVDLWEHSDLGINAYLMQGNSYSKLRLGISYLE